MSEVENISVLW